MAFADLVQIALIGTERFAGTELPLHPSLKPLAAQLNLAQKEATFLSAAALASQYERVGTMPHKEPLPESPAAPEEEKKRASDRANSLLNQIFAGTENDLLPEWLLLAKKSEQLSAPEIVPTLLDRGTSQAHLRGVIAAAVGKKGVWLASQNTSWNWLIATATNLSAEQWETGDLQTREAFLRQTRKADPAKAVELLSATWSAEPPEARIALIKTFEVNLQSSDEAFLEKALADKRKEVRQAAAEHLARLPGSALVQRMTERLKPLLQVEPGKKKPKVEITLPTEFKKEWQRDGLEQKPHAKLGEKIWWIMQMIGVVPATKYAELFNVSLEDFVAATLLTEWKNEFFQAWIATASFQVNQELAVALMKIAMEEEWHSSIPKLLPILPPALQQEWVGELLQNKKVSQELQTDLVLSIASFWNTAFSRTVLAWLRKRTEKETWDWQLRSHLKTFALRLSPEVFAESLTGWNTESAAWGNWASAMEEFWKVIQFRADIHDALLGG